MKGQFMMISSIVAGLILIGTASSISEVRSQNLEPEFVRHDIDLIEDYAENIDDEDEAERQSFRNYVSSIGSYESSTSYWESQECFNVTLETQTSKYEMNCLGNETFIPLTKMVLELDTYADFESKGVYSKSSAARDSFSEDLGLGYRNGESGDSLKGYWRFDNPTASYSLTETARTNSYWTEGSDPDLNVHGITNDLEYETSSTTTVTVNGSNDGFGTWNTRVDLYNYSSSGINWNQDNIGSSDGPIEAIVPADIDGDGDADIVYGSAGENTVKFAENDGTGGGWSKTDIGSQDVESISVGDIDGDGDLDVVGGGNGGNIYFFENDNGDGSSWTKYDIGSNGPGVRSIALGDINDNGRPDIVTTGFGDQIKLWENDGFDSSWGEITVGSGGRWTVATANIDGDDELDIVSGGDNGEVIFWDNEDGDGTNWNSEFIETESGRIFSLAVADIDNDGDLDVFSGIDNSNNDINLYRNDDGTGTSWTTSTIDSRDRAVRTLQTADLDMDGTLDLVSGLNAGSDERVEWHDNDGTFSSWTGNSIGNQGDSGHYGIGVADFNEDGVLDIVSGEDASPADLRLWETTGISTSFIGSDTIEFTDSNGGSKEAEISWTPTGFNYNLVAEVNPAREFTEISETNDETAGSLNNRIVQSVSGSGNVEDYSGEDNNGETINFDGDERGAEGVFSTNSFDFSGEDDVVTVSDDDTLSGMNELTISAWLKETGDPGGNYGHIVSKSAESEGSGDVDYSLVQQSDGDIAFRVNTGGSYSDDRAVGNSLPRNEWVHVVGTWDGSEISLYVDGSLVDTDSTPSDSLNDANGPLGIGRHAENTNDRFFTGNVDEVRIYNQELAESEVESLYFDGNSGDFRGSYSSNSRNLESDQSPVNLTVDSTVPNPSTSAEVTVYHTVDGSTEPRTKSLDSGLKNYTLSFSEEGGTASVEINLDSTDETTTPVIDSLKLWTSNK